MFEPATLAAAREYFARIPAVLRALANWILWRREKRYNKNGSWDWTKTPYQVRVNKKGEHPKAKSNDPATWASYAEVLEAFLAGGFDGIGFCLSGRLIALDLDGCVAPDGTIEAWAEQALGEVGGYQERSPGSPDNPYGGVHVIVEGELPPGKRQWDFKDRKHRLDAPARVTPAARIDFSGGSGFYIPSDASNTFFRLF
jgi:putative DNA primase/helicase